MKVFIKYLQNEITECETVEVKRAWLNSDGSWVEYLDGTTRRIYFVVLISHEWYDERALIWFKRFEKENK